MAQRDGHANTRVEGDEVVCYACGRRWGVNDTSESVPPCEPDAKEKPRKKHTYDSMFPNMVYDRLHYAQSRRRFR